MSLDLMEILGRGFEVFRAKAFEMIVLTLVPVVVSAILGLAVGITAVGSILVPFMAPGFLILLVLSLVIVFIVSVIVGGPMTKISWDVLEDKESSLSEAWDYLRPKIINLVALAIVLAVIVGIGLLLLIIPGIVAFTLLCLSVASLVVGGKGVFGSMNESYSLVRENFLEVLAIVIVLIVAFAIASVLNSLIFPLGLLLLLILIPYSFAVFTTVYWELSKGRSK